MADNSKLELSSELVQEARERVSAGGPALALKHGCAQQNGVHETCTNSQVLREAHHVFSTHHDKWKVTHQRSTGRCWMFAGLNLLRMEAASRMNMKEFEYSQCYTFFWDKFERANYFLQAIVDTARAEHSLDSRVVSFLLDRPLEDGGQWDMFVDLVRKYGLVPKYAMPETKSTEASLVMNRHLKAKLRFEAMKLRTAIVDEKKSPAEVQQIQRAAMMDVYAMLCVNLGTPPTEFDWQYRNKDEEFVREGVFTPLEFAEKYASGCLDEMVSVVHDPRSTSPYNRTFTVELLGNVVGGKPVKYLNICMDELKVLTQKQLESGKVVWFGCDVGKMMHRKAGVWHENMYLLEELYETEMGPKVDSETAKAFRLDYHETLMTHAMMFTGVDVDPSGKPRYWRVENSWGEENGRKGFYTMHDSWFEHFVFEIAVARAELKDPTLMDQEPIVLPPWDPMGALARSEQA